jgi:hypothetical protein
MLAPYVTQAGGDKAYYGDSPMFPVETFDHDWTGLAAFAGERSAFIHTTLAQDGWQVVQDTLR